VFIVLETCVFSVSCKR